jgi:hypothetical protein
VLPEGDRRRRETWIKAIAGVKRPLLQLLEVSPAGEVVEQVQEPIEVPAQEAPLESKFGRIVYPRPAQKSIEQAAGNSPGVEVDLVQQPIIETVKTLPGVEVAPVQEPSLESKFGRIVYPRPVQEAIAPAATISINAESHPTLTGIALSDRFVACNALPQAERHYKVADGEYNVAADGQLSLLFEVVFEEPPDPDDFESLDAFREAIARWDWEHNEVSPEHSDHCSDHLPSFLQNEPPDRYEFDSMFSFWAAYDAWDKVSEQDSEPLTLYYPLTLSANGLRVRRTGTNPTLCSNRPPCRNCHRSATFPSLRTFLFRLFAVWAIGSTAATNRPTQGFSRAYSNQSPPNFPRKLVNQAFGNYLETIPKASRQQINSFAAARISSRPDRHRGAMPVFKWS